MISLDFHSAAAWRCHLVIGVIYKFISFQQKRKKNLFDNLLFVVSLSLGKIIFHLLRLAHCQKLTLDCLLPLLGDNFYVVCVVLIEDLRLLLGRTTEFDEFRFGRETTFLHMQNWITAIKIHFTLSFQFSFAVVAVAAGFATVLRSPHTHFRSTFDDFSANRSKHKPSLDRNFRIVTMSWHFVWRKFSV